MYCLTSELCWKCETSGLGPAVEDTELVLVDTEARRGEPADGNRLASFSVEVVETDPLEEEIEARLAPSGLVGL